MPSTPLDSVAVVTVSYNSSAVLKPFLESIDASEGERVAVVIADNASEDREQGEALASEHGATFLELGTNRGYGGAINAAVATLDPHFEYILVSNPDVVLHPGAISAMLDRLAGDDHTAAVGPRILNADGSVYPSARRLPSLRTGVGHAVFSGIWPSNPWTSAYRSDREGSEAERKVGWLSGSCLLIRRSAFDQ